MILKDLCKALNDKAPEKLFCREGDKVGLFVGDENSDVKKIVTATEARSEVIDYAIENKVDMILVHHPFFFGGVERVVTSDILSKKIYKLIQNNVAVYSMHTNLDSVEGGLNDVFAKLLGLKNVIPIERKKIKYYMLIGFVQEEYKEKVLNALFQAGAGSKNNYENVYFNYEGTGHFTAVGEANPLIGVKNQPVSVKEQCFSVLASELILDKVIQTYNEVHPYDVPVYYVAESPECDYVPNLGRVGELPKEMCVEEFTELCKEAFCLPYAKCNFNCDRNLKIKKVGLCSGSGMSIFDKACEMGCDAFVCGDIKHDQYLHATDMGKLVLDLGHYETECTSSIVLADYVKEIDNRIEIINFEEKIGNPLVCKMLSNMKD